MIAGLSGADASMLFLSCEEGKSQRDFGVYDSLGTVGLLAAAAIFSLWVGENYRLAGKLTVISYGAAAVLSLGLREVKAPETSRASVREFAAVLRQTVKNKPLLLFLLGSALLTETGQTVTVFLNQLQYVRCGISAATIGMIYSAVTLAELCGVFFFGATICTAGLSAFFYWNRRQCG